MSHSSTSVSAGRNPARVATAGMVGTSLEFYDHFIYGSAAALVFPKLFFPQDDPRMALLLSLASYGIAFVARPLGAAIFGHFGDRLGRKRILFITLPVGILAPTLLALLRLMQGLALGGEWGGAALMVNESEGKAKGFLGSLVQVASPIGFLLANLAFATVTALVSEDAFMSWGWRLPFLASCVLVGVGLYIRLSLDESPEFEKLRASGKVENRSAPLVEVCSKHWNKLLIAVGARAGSDIAFYVFSLFLQVYLLRIGLSRAIALQASVLAAVSQLVAIPFFGWLTDRWGSRVVLTLGAVGSMVWVFIFFVLVDTRIPSQIIIASMVGMFIHGALWAPLASFLPQMFPTHVRFTGAGLGFQLAGVVGGAFAPLISVSLLDYYGTSQAVAVYVAGAIAFVLVAVGFAKRQEGR